MCWGLCPEMTMMSSRGIDGLGGRPQRGNEEPSMLFDEK